MRLVLLTLEGLEHRYLTHMLAREFGDELCAVVIADPPRRGLGTRWRSYARRYTVPQLFSRANAKMYQTLRRRGQRKAATYQRLFFPEGEPPRTWSAMRHTVPTHNGPECQDLLRRLAPDIIAVYGTGIIRARIIRLAGKAILNMHTGLSPRYRGSDTIFWPLYHEEPDWIGVTIHVLDEGLDSGPIIRTGRPEIAADDHEDSLFCKAVMVGAPLYADAIRTVFQDGVSAAPQQLEQGRMYRFVDRTVAAERQVGRLLRDGLLRRYLDHQ